ncbi:MAG TPA: hypothetical protein DCZ91_05230 [Lachnospiraceae bacterium]|nr:hypothetical protein [Lachnospiraceae bacterium]
MQKGPRTETVFKGGSTVEKTIQYDRRCLPGRHYMVDMERQLSQMEHMVEQGDYFYINRGRQYGKTPPLSLLRKRMEDRYTVFSVSFEGSGEAPFASAENLAYTRN